MNSIDDLIAITGKLKLSKFVEAEIIFLAGSFVRGDATATSDLDLVVLYETLPEAYRESFEFMGYPVEAFVHDLETLKYFFLEIDRPSGIPSLATMVAEGIEVPEQNEFSKVAKKLAQTVLVEGPPAWGRKEVDRSRYMVTSLIDDIVDPRNRNELYAVGTALYEALANHYFRSKNEWTAKGKSIPRRLLAFDANMAQCFSSSFSALFINGDMYQVTDLVDLILEDDGGRLFEGYTLKAPTDWRMK